MNNTPLRDLINVLYGLDLLYWVAIVVSHNCYFTSYWRYPNSFLCENNLFQHKGCVRYIYQEGQTFFVALTFPFWCRFYSWLLNTLVGDIAPPVPLRDAWVFWAHRGLLAILFSMYVCHDQGLWDSLFYFLYYISKNRKMFSKERLDFGLI